MKTAKTAKTIILVLAFAGMGLARPLAAQGQSTPTAKGFDQLKTLAGEWEGTGNEGGKEFPAITSFRMVSDNSVVMNVLGAGSPHEMVTMFHLDGSDLLATHYCAAHNQPRFRLVASSEPNVLNFEFKDATNLPSPEAPHMVGVKFTFLDANHHYEDWTFLAKGQATTRRFDFRRKN